MKTIAIIASCDTKFQEVSFIRDCFKDSGINLLVVDMAIGPISSHQVDISREEVVATTGMSWEEIKGRTKGELIHFMTNAIRETICLLHKQNRIDGVLSIGGVQNTTVATEAMRALPLGFPTVMLSTVASGGRIYRDIVGDKDLVTIPSISDFSGLNCMTRTMIANACAAIRGMVVFAGIPLSFSQKPTVAISLMGVTNTAAIAAVEEFEKNGLGAVGFHATGAGGSAMERMAHEGWFDGVLDLTTHEITAEYFGGGFSYGANDRLSRLVELDIPLVVSVGGLDFIDYDVKTFSETLAGRKYDMHNKNLAHIKILPREAQEIGQIFAERLNKTKTGLTLLLPTEGMRENTRPGESLFDELIDKRLIRSIIDNLDSKVEVITEAGNLNDASWGVRAARRLIFEMKRRDKVE